MVGIWVYALLSVFLVSLVSFVGIFTLSIKLEKLKKMLIYLISFSAGALFGDAFIHLIPELIEEDAFGLTASLSLVFGILLFFTLEKVIHWRHCHMPITKEHTHPFAFMNLIGDGLHNLIDGLIIGASFIVSIPAGIATTLAVFLHEIPQEIGDFGILIHGGFSRGKALLLNFASALLAIVGVILSLWLGTSFEGIQYILVSIAAGGFIYIAGSDLIPELHKETAIKVSLGQIATFILGVLIMASLLLLE